MFFVTSSAMGFGEAILVREKLTIVSFMRPFVCSQEDDGWRKRAIEKAAWRCLGVRL